MRLRFGFIPGGCQQFIRLFLRSGRFLNCSARGGNQQAELPRSAGKK
jgi:hypothetical protein